MKELKRLYSMKQSKKKDLLLLANKLIEKIPDTVNAKEHYQSFIRKKNNKLVKKTKNNYSSTKNFGNPNIVDIKSVITKTPKNVT